MALIYEEVLKKMGWVDGFRVPIANEENKVLEAELEQLMLRKAKAVVAYNNADTRFKNLEKHLKYVIQESDQNQVLLCTYQQQIDQEQNLLKSKQHEKENLAHSICKLKKQEEEIEERSNQQRSNLEKSLVKLEKLKAESTWDNDALNAWEEALKRRDEDNYVLKHFSLEDQKKANDLEARRQNLQMELIKRQELVTKVSADLKNYELVLDRTGKTFQQMQEERTSLVKQWQIAVNMLRQRNSDIEKVHTDITTTQEVIQQQMETLDDQNNFLEREKHNNKEMLFEIESLNVNSSRIRRARNEMSEHVLTLKSELNTLKRNMVATANELDNKRKKMKDINNEIIEKQEKIELRSDEIDNLRKKLEEVAQTSSTADQRAKTLEQIIQLEEKNFNGLVQDHARLQSLLYRNQQVLYELQCTGTLKETSIDNFKTTFNACKKDLGNVYVELERTKEIAYNIEYRINEAENKLLQIEGSAKTEDVQAMEARIEELNNTLSKHLEVKTLLSKEIRRLDDEMRRLSVAISTDRAHLDVVKGKLQDQVLLFEGGLKQAGAAKQKSQQMQVEENILKLKTDQFEKAIKNQTERLYNLQRFRLDLDSAMKEKQVSIETTLEVLKIKKRNLEEEIHRLKCDVVSRDLRIEQFQKKHHLVVMSFGKDENGEPLSTTQLKIKNAQEKYMLVTEGDELDNKIKKTESEIMAMENTLKVINSTNVSYKKSLAPMEESAEEVHQMKELDDAIYDFSLAIRSQKKLISNAQSNIKELHKSIEEARAKIEELQSNIDVLHDAYTKFRQEEQDRNLKIVRAEKQIKQLMKRLDSETLGKYNKDLMMQQLLDSNKSALYQLSDIMDRNPEITPFITELLHERNIPTPKPRSLASIFKVSSESSLSASSSTNITSSSSSGRGMEIPRVTLQLQVCDTKRDTCQNKKQ